MVTAASDSWEAKAVGPGPPHTRQPVRLSSDELPHLLSFILLFWLTSRISVIFMTFPQGQSFGVFQTNLVVVTHAGRTLSPSLRLSTCGGGTLAQCISLRALWVLTGNIIKYFLNTTAYYHSDSHQSGQLCLSDQAPQQVMELIISILKDVSLNKVGGLDSKGHLQRRHVLCNLNTHTLLWPFHSKRPVSPKVGEVTAIIYSAFFLNQVLPPRHRDTVSPVLGF